MKKVKQKELAKYFNITENTITNWKKSKKKENLFKAIKLFYIAKKNNEIERILYILQMIDNSIDMLDKNEETEVEGETIHLNKTAKERLISLKSDIKEIINDLKDCKKVSEKI